MTNRSGETTATLKFYNIKNGYGFAKSPVGDLYISSSVALGFGEQLQAGVSLAVSYRTEDKGLAVVEILSVGSDDSVEFYDGEVKFFNRDKGYGFVISGDFKEDMFLHQSVMKKAGITSLAVGERVRFCVGDRNGKRQINSVEVLSAASPLKQAAKRPGAKASKKPQSSKKRGNRDRYDAEARA